MRQAAQVLGAGFGDAVEVLGNRRDRLVDPRSGVLRGGISASPKTVVEEVNTNA
jgi:hypothetical protein